LPLRHSYEKPAIIRQSTTLATTSTLVSSPSSSQTLSYIIMKPAFRNRRQPGGIYDDDTVHTVCTAIYISKRYSYSLITKQQAVVSIKLLLNSMIHSYLQHAYTSYFYLLQLTTNTTHAQHAAMHHR
jgi:hypothetical protein